LKQEANGHLLKPLFPEINSTLVQPISTAYPLFLGTPNTARSMQVWPILVLMLCHPNKLRIQMVSQSHKYASMCAHVHVHTCTHTHISILANISFHPSHPSQPPTWMVSCRNGRSTLSPITFMTSKLHASTSLMWWAGSFVHSRTAPKPLQTNRMGPFCTRVHTTPELPPSPCKGTEWVQFARACIPL